MPSPAAGHRRRWAADEERFRSDGVVAAVSPCVMDSWLVDDGHTRAPERHAARFVAGCAERGVSEAFTITFLGAAAATVPACGRWFPRVELVATAAGDRQFQGWIRPAPPRGRSVRLWVQHVPDTRQRPQVKGPDQAFLGARRQEAISHGADDAVMLAADGTVLETTTASLLWWRGDTLCMAPPTDDVLPGVTAGLLCDAARDVGIRVVEERARLTSLAGLEVWATNALHGIRPVVGWVGGDIPVGAAPRAPGWNDHLDRLRSSIHSSSPEEPPFLDLLSSIPVRSS